MPLIEDKGEQYAYARAIGVPDWEPEAVPFKELLRASYRTDNTIGSFFARNKGLPDNIADDESFNPWDHFTDDEKINEQFVSNAALADTQDELNAVRSQMDRENRDRQTITDGGMMGFVTGAIVGVADPINLIPVGGAAYGSYRTGASILKGAAATASVAAGSQAMVEAALHHSQLTRTYGESGANIAGAALLGGVLGAGVSAIAVRNNTKLLEQVNRSLDPEARLQAGQNPILDNDSVGAARVDNDIQVSGKIARALTKALGLDPLSQTITSTLKETRSLSAKMAENPIAMEHKSGEAYVPDSVESLAKIKDGLLLKALQGHLSAFDEYRKAGGKLKRKAFSEAVSKEMRNPDTAQDPAIVKAASAWRTELYDPLKKEVIDLDLLPEDVDVNTAVNYLNRSYNKGAITANMDRWVEVVGGWLKGQNIEKQRIQGEMSGRLETVKTDIKRLDRKTRSAQVADKQLATLTKQLEEIQRQQKGSIERQVSLEDSALSKAVKQQAEIDAKVRESMNEDFNKFQEGEVTSLEVARDKGIKEIDKQAKKIGKGAKKIGRTIGEFGGLNREVWEAEGVDPAFFKDPDVKGGFGKPVFRKEGGLTPDGLAEKLDEEGIIPGATADDAIEYVDDYLAYGDEFVDPEVIATLDQLEGEKNFLTNATDKEIESLYFGKSEGLPQPEEIPLQVDEAGTPQVGPEGKAISPLSQREIKVASTRLRNRSEKLRDQVAAKKDKARILREDIAKIEARNADDLAKLEENIAAFPSKTGNAVRAAIKSRDADLPQSLTKALTKAAKSIEARDLEEFDHEDLAMEIASRIIGTPDGRLPYDYKIGSNSDSAPTKSKPGPLNNRSFVIPDEMIEEFMVNDVEALGGRYLQSLAMDIELTRKFGDADMTDEISGISKAWDKEIREASKTDPKKALKLGEKKKDDIRNIAAMRDRLRGQYGAGDPDNIWSRAMRVSRDINYLRLMGGVTASSIPDVARVVMAEGLAKTFSTGLNELISNTRAFKVSAQEGKEWGIGIESIMSGRSQILADVADYQQGGTALERGLRTASDNFGKINMLDRWTAGVKQLHHVVAQTSMANAMVAGKYNKQWANMGIGADDAKHMADQLRRYGKKDGKTWIANTKDWDNQSLALMWGTALRKESDRVIIYPGQEKPLFMSSEMGKTIWQFRSFMFAATQRVMIAGVQGQDRHIIQGALGLVSLGSMAYVFKQWDAGREISDDPMVWLTEGIDRSGMLGLIMEANNTVEKMSKNTLGMRPVLGIDTPGSRFASRSQAESFLGPTYGSLLENTLKVLGGSLEGESDTRAIRRLLPYQNLVFFRQGLDKIEESIK